MTFVSLCVFAINRCCDEQFVIDMTRGPIKLLMTNYLLQRHLAANVRTKEGSSRCQNIKI